MSSPVNDRVLHKPGDYTIDKCVLHSMVNGTTVDLSGLFKKLEIYEDIFSPYISAKIYIEDAYNFPEKLPMVGQEKLELTLKTDLDSLEPIDLVFRVYKFDSQKLGDTGKTQQYVLHLVSEGAYFNYSERCGYALSGPISTMVYSIFKKHFPEAVWKDKLYIEPTNDNYSFVLPMSNSPFKSISWLASKAHSVLGSEFSPYLFYETLDGHRFVSISKIIDDNSPAVITYIYTVGNMPDLPNERSSTTTPGIVDSVLPIKYHKVQTLEELERFDTASNIMNGVISSRLIIHDLLHKEHRDIHFFESAVFETTKRLGDGMHFKNTDPEASRLLGKGSSYHYLPSTSYTVSNKIGEMRDNFMNEPLYLARKHHINSFLTQKLIIGVFGDSRRRVGNVVDLIVPKIQSDAAFQTDKKDKNLSGQYLVTCVRHVFTDKYEQKLELSRNGMGL